MADSMELVETDGEDKIIVNGKKKVKIFRENDPANLNHGKT